jgi:hydrogenase maturation protease
MKTLLLGMGNPILCDDAVGVRLAHDFKGKLMGIPDLDVIEECSVGGLDLLDILSGYDRVLILDSIRTSAGFPGEWYYFTAEALRETVHLTNIHDTNFATALKLGHSVGMALPKLNDIHIFAVEAKENLIFSERMTPELEGAFSCYASAILSEIRGLLQAQELWQKDPRMLPSSQAVDVRGGTLIVNRQPKRGPREFFS